MLVNRLIRRREVGCRRREEKKERGRGRKEKRKGRRWEAHVWAPDSSLVL
jgi:hypothetical protein